VRDERIEAAVNALQTAILHAGHLQLTLHEDVTELGKLYAALQRAVAALQREKGGA
jgi:hypothetical protein